MRILLFLFFLSASPVFGQHEFMTWLSAGADGKITKKLKWEAEFTARFDGQGAQTLFPQAGLEYKVTKWFRPSIDYRFLIDKNKYGNYKVSNRINVNLNFKHAYKRLDYGIRLRYQYSFNRISQEAYDADFDQAIRVKPSFEYNIKGSKISPEVSTELFYNPNYGPTSPGFSKIRTAAGLNFNLKGPHTLGVKYLFDKKFRDYKDAMRHVLSVSYSVSF